MIKLGFDVVDESMNKSSDVEKFCQSTVSTNVNDFAQANVIVSFSQKNSQFQSIFRFHSHCQKYSKASKNFQSPKQYLF